MPVFQYIAKNAANQTQKGEREAASEIELARSLRNEGLFLTSVKILNGKKKKPEQKLTDFFSIFFGNVPLMEKILFAQNLSVMIGAGLSLNRALEASAQQTNHRKFSQILNQICEDIKKGISLTDSLVKYPKVFSPLFVNMVKVGEASGTLEKVLKILADQMKKEHALISKIRHAMIYPIVIILAMIGVGVLMMVVVVPQLISVFKEMNTELPLATKFLINSSEFLSHHWILGFLIIVALISTIRFFLKTKIGIFYFDWTILRLPIFGNISRKLNSARLARTLGSLIESGVPIIQGLKIVSGTLSNSFFRNSLQTAADNIQKGESLNGTIRFYHELYPPMVGQMVELGEETGTLGEILSKLADFYEEEVDNITKSLASIIEPLLMIVIGVVVGFFAISLIQPMYGLMQNM